MHPLDHIARLDGVAQAELVARGELSALELIDACQRRFELVNPLINAVVAADFDAARARARSGVSGPFAGVPFLFKDLCAVPGLRCAFGSRLFAKHLPPTGSPFSERVHASGLVTVGKSATSELGSIHNIAGCPAMSVPLYWAPDGVPIGSHFRRCAGARRRAARAGLSARAGAAMG